MDKVSNGNIHLMNRRLIWNAMMKEGLALSQFWPVESKATKELTGEHMQDFLDGGGGLLLLFLLSNFIVPATLS